MDPEPFIAINPDKHKAVVIYRMIHNNPDTLRDWCLGPVDRYFRTTSVTFADFWTMTDRSSPNPMLICALDVYPEDRNRVDWALIKDHEHNIKIDEPVILYRDDLKFRR